MVSENVQKREDRCPSSYEHSVHGLPAKKLYWKVSYGRIERWVHEKLSCGALCATCQAATCVNWMRCCEGVIDVGGSGRSARWECAVVERRAVGKGRRLTRAKGFVLLAGWDEVFISFSRRRSVCTFA